MKKSTKWIIYLIIGMAAISAAAYSIIETEVPIAEEDLFETYYGALAIAKSILIGANIIADSVCGCLILMNQQRS